MKAVNLVPADARRGRTAGGGGGAVSLGPFGPAQFLIVLLVIVVALVLLRVLADNTVNNKKATLAAVNAQVAAADAQASRLSKYVTLVQNIEQTEAQVKKIAEERFPWKRALDQISHVLPASTSLTTLSATTSGPGSTATTAANGPGFSISGCADTPNQNGVATLLRRLTQITGVTNVGFQNSTRTPECGNSFNISLLFASPGTTSTKVSTSATPTTTSTTATTTTGTTGG